MIFKNTLEMNAMSLPAVVAQLSDSESLAGIIDRGQLGPKLFTEVKQADRAYLESGGSFKAVVVALLSSDSFLYRK